jgi:hypothetical protein
MRPDAAPTSPAPSEPTSEADDASAGASAADVAGARGEQPGREDPGPEAAGQEELDSDDPVVALRIELETIGQLPVAERLPRFERANAVLADELAALDEV